MSGLPKELDPKQLSHLPPEEQRKILSLPQAIDQVAASVMDYFIESQPQFLSALTEAGKTPENFEAEMREAVAEALRKSGINV